MVATEDSLVSRMMNFRASAKIAINRTVLTWMIFSPPMPL
jgi:hypothetical protein